MLGLLHLLCIKHLKYIIVEDLIHPDLPNCLYSRLDSKPMAAFLFEDPKLCHGCLDFYSYLGLEPEILELVDVLKRISL